MTSFSPQITSREAGEILSYHSLDYADLDGKVVADLGCGGSNFGADLHEAGIDAYVVGVDISPDSIDFPIQRENEQNYTRRIQGNLSSLPIRSGSVDIALATYSLPFWSRNVEETRQFYREIARVTKLGGLISIYPIAVTRQHSNSSNPSQREEMLLAAMTGAQDFVISESWETLPAVQLLKAKRIS
jgi:ubiquinone/menaquinone biosynthesis C-methylase UbiE